MWNAVRELHEQEYYVSGSAIAEGGLLLRIFEAALGSGMGAKIEFNAPIQGRRDGWLFGEFVGSMLLEVSPDAPAALSRLNVPCQQIGEVISEPRIVLAEGGNVMWQDEISRLESIWSRTLREVLE